MKKKANELDVFEPHMWMNATGPAGWYAVADDYGIIAYFLEEDDAHDFVRMRKLKQERAYYKKRAADFLAKAKNK